MSIPTFEPTGKVARIFPSRSFSLALDGGQTASIDRSIEARARARRSGTSDRWDRGRLPSLRETTHRIVRGKWGGGEIVQTQHPNERESTSKGFVFGDEKLERESETTTTTRTTHPHLVREVQILHDSFVDFWIVQVAFDLRSRSSPPRDVFLVLLVVGG